MVLALSSLSMMPSVGSEAVVTAPSPVAANYVLSMGDLMTLLVQPRHTKLGLAGREHNWDYARYELTELLGAFRRLQSAIPTYHSIDISTIH